MMKLGGWELAVADGRWLKLCRRKICAERRRRCQWASDDLGQVDDDVVAAAAGQHRCFPFSRL